jgi:hypothetical protein
VAPEDVIVFGRSLGVPSPRGWRGAIPVRTWSSTADSLRCGRRRAVSVLSRPLLLLHPVQYPEADPGLSLSDCDHAPDRGQRDSADTASASSRKRRSQRFIPLRGNHYGNEWQTTPGLRTLLGS